MATNYMGHFYLVNLLLPKMKAQLSSSRIVVVSSRYHTNARLDINDLHFSGSSTSNTSSSTSSSSSRPNRYCPRIAHANSKLASILFARALALRLEDTPVIAVALHPGRVSTPLRKHFIPEEVMYMYICMYVRRFQYFKCIHMDADVHMYGRVFDRSFSRHSSQTSRFRRVWPLLYTHVSLRK